jgi:hypothetical protein
MKAKLGFNTSYVMRLAGSGKFVLQARKKMSRKAHYTFSYQEGKSSNASAQLGKLRRLDSSNYVLYDNGKAPRKTRNDAELR